MTDFTKVAAFLSDRAEDVLASARASIARAHLPHYERAGEAATMDRLRDLYALVVLCAVERHLAPIAEWAARVAAERHAAGVDLGEVQTAINVLEEAIWRAVLAEMPAAAQGEALGVVGTILGAAKDRLACTYVSLAACQSTHTLDLAELFHGPGEGDAAPV
jgi:hypothetical protein